MKNKFRLLAFLIVSMAFSSCGSDDGGGGSSDSYIRVRVDGQNYRTIDSDFAPGAYGSKVFSNIALTGLFSLTADQMISISFPDNVEAGEDYNISTLSDTFFVGINVSEDLHYDTSSCENANGTLHINSISETRVSGTFSFQTRESEFCSGDVVEITNGEFNVILDTQE